MHHNAPLEAGPHPLCHSHRVCYSPCCIRYSCERLHHSREPLRHSREGGNPAQEHAFILLWIPAFAGMTARVWGDAPVGRGIPGPNWLHCSLLGFKLGN